MTLESHKNSILNHSLNLIRASFGESEKARGKERRFGNHSLFSPWPTARKWDPQCNIKDGSQARKFVQVVAQ